MTEYEHRRLDLVYKAVFGNGEEGIIEEMRALKRVLYADRQTGSKGLVDDVRELSQYVHSLQVTLSTLNWLLGFLGVTSLIALANWFFRP